MRFGYLVKTGACYNFWGSVAEPFPSNLIKDLG